jgi:PAS domain-containing protein
MESGAGAMDVADEKQPDDGELEGPVGSVVMTAVQDFDGYTLSMNGAYQAALEWSLDELSAVPFWELVHPDDQDRIMEDREQLVLHGPGRMFAHRVRMLCPDGTHRCIHWDIRASAEEERIYLAGVDVSHRELFVAGKRFLVGSWDWGISRDSATWSEGLFEIYGLPPATEHSLEIALQRLHEDDRVAVAEKVRHALATGQPYAATHRIVRPDGAIRWLYSTGRVFTGEDGEPQRVRGLTWDVTDSWRSPAAR